ncbi:MAG TPA: T9SS type A sorting domain-containing protein, partial [bacterium]
SAEWPWNLNYAYCLNLKSAASWGFADLERFTLNAVNDFDPDPAWDSNVLDPNSLATEWFFMGYAAPGYCKLASISMIGPQPPSGDPQYFQYEGPFHWLIWYNSDDPEHPEYPDNFPRWDLRVVRDDEGRFYIQDPDPVNHRQFPIDQIGTLIPGKGYYLGFNADPNETYDFAGWINWPQWRDGDYVPPEPPSNQRGTASGAHFQYTKYTQWAYPVIIDTVDLGQCPMSLGDEIGVFDGDLCVGFAAYPDSFPLVITCWEDDIATPSELDGYLWNNPMTFIWYDASANAEVEFQLPPETQAAENDAIAPEHSGFGRGFFAKRSFTNGVSTVTPLPQEYKIRQNFPNPFNAETVIPLELPQRSKIRLEIYNVNGQRLGLPFEHTYDAGWPKIRWNAAKLPSGIYFYRITAEGLERGGIFVDAGKMLVLK